MKKRPYYHPKDAEGAENTVRQFQKSLATYILMLFFFGFLFLRIRVPAFVFFIIAIPMTISIIHKYIDVYHSKKNSSTLEDLVDDRENEEEEYLEEDELDLDEFKSLRKEWKDSDFI